MKRLSQQLVLSCCVLIAACATNQSLFVPVSPSLEKGSVVYIYRPAKIANAMLTPEVNIAGISNFGISNDKYKQLYLQQGKHLIRLEATEGNTPRLELELEVLKGRVYYLRVDSSMKIAFGHSYQPYKRKFELLTVSAATARTEISACTDMDAADKQPLKIDKSESATFSVDKTINPFSH